MDPNETGYATDPPGPWDVGSGSEELNGTYDMMGNVFEWTESPFDDPNYGTDAARSKHGGAFGSVDSDLSLDHYRALSYPNSERNSLGFRVASVPEPVSISLLICGAVALLAYAWRRRRR